MRDLRRPLFPISVTSSLVGVSPSALRRWERAGIVTPARDRRGWRLFSWEDIETLRRAKPLVRRGLPLVDVRRQVRRRPRPLGLLLPLSRPRLRRVGVLALPVIVRTP